MYKYNSYPYLCDYIAYLETNYKKLHTNYKKLKTINKDLRDRASKTLHIERMEYKIHELNVSSLSGTMNLGVTAQADENTMTDLMNQLTKTGNFNVTIGDQEESIEPEDLSSQESSPPIETDEPTTTP